MRLRAGVFVWVHGREGVLWGRVALLIPHATRMPHIASGASGSTIFLDIISQTTLFSGKKVTEHKMCVLSFSKILSETFLILSRIQRDIVVNVKTPSCKVPVIRVVLYWNLNFLDRFSEKAQFSNFIKIRPVGAELFHAGGRTDGRTYDVANSRFSQFWWTHPKMKVRILWFQILTLNSQEM